MVGWMLCCRAARSPLRRRSADCRWACSVWSSWSILPRYTKAFGGRTLLGFLLLQLAGRLCNRSSTAKARSSRGGALVTGAVQQVAGGLAAFVLGRALRRGAASPYGAAGGRSRVSDSFWLDRRLFGFYLCHDRLPVAVVSIYMFVNPVVALFLGYLFFREPFSYRAGSAMLTIFAGIRSLARWSEATGRASAL